MVRTPLKNIKYSTDRDLKVAHTTVDCECHGHMRPPPPHIKLDPPMKTCGKVTNLVSTG